MICLSLSLPSTLSLSIMWRKQKTKETAYSKSPYESFLPPSCCFCLPPQHSLCAPLVTTLQLRESVRMCVCVCENRKKQEQYPSHIGRVLILLFLFCPRESFFFLQEFLFSSPNKQFLSLSLSLFFLFFPFPPKWWGQG